MGVHKLPAKMPVGIRTYYVDEVVQEDAGNGNVRVWNYTRKNGILVPEFEVIIASKRLMIVGRKVADFAEEIFKAQQIRLPGMKVH